MDKAADDGEGRLSSLGARFLEHREGKHEYKRKIRIKQEELTNGYNFFNQIRDTFNKEYLDNNIFEYYKNKYTYTKVNNTHIINDYYTEEKSKLIINKTYLIIKTTLEYSSFLKAITKKKNIFVRCT